SVLSIPGTVYILDMMQVLDQTRRRDGLLQHEGCPLQHRGGQRHDHEAVGVVVMHTRLGGADGEVKLLNTDASRIPHGVTSALDCYARNAHRLTSPKELGPGG